VAKRFAEKPSGVRESFRILERVSRRFLWDLVIRNHICRVRQSQYPAIFGRLTFLQCGRLVLRPSGRMMETISSPHGQHGRPLAGSQQADAQQITRDQSARCFSSVQRGPQGRLVYVSSYKCNWIQLTFDIFFFFARPGVALNAPQSLLPRIQGGPPGNLLSRLEDAYICCQWCSALFRKPTVSFAESLCL
jgi:hypothetical protein